MNKVIVQLKYKASLMIHFFMFMFCFFFPSDSTTKWVTVSIKQISVVCNIFISI